MKEGGLSRRQKLVVAVMMVTLVAVLVALTSLVRGNVATSPLSTAALPVAQATATQPAKTPVSDPSVDPAPTVPTVSERDGVKTARLIQSFSTAVGKIRELPKQQEIPLNFLDAQDMASHLRGIRAVPARRDFVERQQPLLAALDLTPRVDEAFPTTVQTRAKNVIAFYDPQQQQIFIGPAGFASEEPDISLVHQFAHAYIDQHFDLSNLLEEESSGDAVRALDALVEGDAMLVLGLHHLGRVDYDDLDELALRMIELELTDYEDFRISRASDDLVLFPYREGARFAAALLEAGWWPSVNAVYLDPPISSEQILHPTKYIEEPRDVPRAVSLPDLGADLEQGWRVVAQDVLGELVLRAHLDYYLVSTPEAVSAAEGWDGDLAVLWQDEENREVLAIRSVWDSSEDATQFANAYASLIENRLNNPLRVRRPIVPRGGRWWRGDQGDAYVQREDDTVLVIWAPESDVMERVLSAFVFGSE